MPNAPGVYRFLNKKKETLYVGKAKDLKKRVANYFTGSVGVLGQKTQVLVSQISFIHYTIVGSELESLLLEASLIKKYSPFYNAKLTDGKAYPLVRITTGSEFPAIFLARRPDDSSSSYFGPFPNASDVRHVLRVLRKIFPFQSTINHPKHICLYNHLGLCPCVSAKAQYGSEEAFLAAKKQYKKTIKRILAFLSGDILKVTRELEKERDVCSKQEFFEEAKKLQQTIDAIASITQKVHTPFEYDLNPNLASDVRKRERDSLQNVLRENGVRVTGLHRIECYDISNISGQHAVGSMVVFTNGEKDSSAYRRFKISKEITGPNDFAMMAHMLKRRSTHTQWEMPNLIVIDGGKGQVSTVVKTLAAIHFAVPVIGLAKRLETIVTADLKEVTIPKNHPGLQLLMRIRNEAHRFAITYHKKLRRKFIFE